MSKALLQAADRGDILKVRELLAKADINPNFKDEKGETALIKAVRRRYKDIVETIVTLKPETIDASDKEGNTAMICAAWQGSLEIVKILYKHSPDSLKARDNDKSTAFILAAYDGHNDVIKFILSQDKKAIEERDLSGRTAIMQAAYNGHVTTIQILLEANPNGLLEFDLINNSVLMHAVQGKQVSVLEFIRSKLDKKEIWELLNKHGSLKQTPLMYAAANGFLECVLTILDMVPKEQYRGLLTAVCTKNETALMLASRYGHAPIVKHLAKLDPGGLHLKSEEHLTPLMMAAMNGHKKSVEEILSIDFKTVTAVDDREFTPLMFAAFENRIEVVELLASKLKPEALTIKKKDGITAYHLAAEEGWDKIIEVLSKYNRNGLDEVDVQGNTCLLTAAWMGHDKFIQTIAKINKECLNARGLDNQTALMYAAEQGHLKTVNTLLGLKFSLLFEVDRLGKTALMWAALTGHCDIVQRLVSLNRSGLHDKDAQGLTPLMWAAFEGKTAVVELLCPMLDRKAINETMTDGRTALKLAVTKKHYLLAQVLVKAGAEWYPGFTNSQAALVAAEQNRTADIEILFTLDKSYLNARDQNGLSTLMVAATYGCTDTVKTIIRLKPASLFEVDNLDRTALIQAVKGRHRDTVQILARLNKKGIGAVDIEGLSAIMWAALEGFTEIVEDLGKMDANLLFTKDKLGFTASMHAERNGHTETAAVIKALNPAAYCQFKPIRIEQESSSKTRSDSRTDRRSASRSECGSPETQGGTEGDLEGIKINKPIAIKVMRSEQDLKKGQGFNKEQELKKALELKREKDLKNQQELTKGKEPKAIMDRIQQELTATHEILRKNETEIKATVEQIQQLKASSIIQKHIDTLSSFPFKESAQEKIAAKFSEKLSRIKAESEKALCFVNEAIKQYTTQLTLFEGYQSDIAKLSERSPHREDTPASSEAASISVLASLKSLKANADSSAEQIKLLLIKLNETYLAEEELISTARTIFEKYNLKMAKLSRPQGSKINSTAVGTPKRAIMQIRTNVVSPVTKQSVSGPLDVPEAASEIASGSISPVTFAQTALETKESSPSEKENKKPMTPWQTQRLATRSERIEEFNKQQRLASQMAAARREAAEKETSLEVKRVETARLNAKLVKKKQKKAGGSLYFTGGSRLSPLTVDQVSGAFLITLRADELKLLEDCVKYYDGLPKEIRHSDTKREIEDHIIEENALIGVIGQLAEVMQNELFSTGELQGVFTDLRDIIFHDDKLLPALTCPEDWTVERATVHNNIRSIARKFLEYVSKIQKGLKRPARTKVDLLAELCIDSLDKNDFFIRMITRTIVKPCDQMDEKMRADLTARAYRQIEIAKNEIAIINNQIEEIQKSGQKNPQFLATAKTALLFSQTKIGTNAAHIRDLTRTTKPEQYARFLNTPILGVSVEWYLKTAIKFRHPQSPSPKPAFN